MDLLNKIKVGIDNKYDSGLKLYTDYPFWSFVIFKIIIFLLVALIVYLAGLDASSASTKTAYMIICFTYLFNHIVFVNLYNQNKRSRGFN